MRLDEIWATALLIYKGATPARNQRPRSARQRMGRRWGVSLHSHQSRRSHQRERLDIQHQSFVESGLPGLGYHAGFSESRFVRSESTVAKRFRVFPTDSAI